MAYPPNTRVGGSSLASSEHRGSTLASYAEGPDSEALQAAIFLCETYLAGTPASLDGGMNRE